MSTNSLEPKTPTSDQQQIRVRRGRVESVDLYEIKENELELLEKGAPSGLFLNFAVFLLSLAFGAITTLSTATFANTSIQTLFVVVSVVGVLGGTFLIILWWRSRESITQVIRHIRGRIPPEVGHDQEISSSINVAPKG